MTIIDSRLLKFTVPGGVSYVRLKRVAREQRLSMICLEARCPNIGECSALGSAAFLIMGNICTRVCAYCSVRHGIPSALDMDEPKRVAKAAATLELPYIVITSVTRDDIEDGGASFFAKTISEIHRAAPECAVEALVPDFAGRLQGLDEIAAARPQILNHNIEAAKAIYAAVRPQGNYSLSLDLLKRASGKGLAVKSGLMIGFGESLDDVLYTFDDLLRSGCLHITIGQYFTSRIDGFPVKKYYHEDELEEIRKRAVSMGFAKVSAGINVRSSYHASDFL